MPPQPWARRAVVTFLALAGVLLGVLVATGVWLALDYRPSPSAAWNSPDLPSSVQASDRVRLVHRTASHLLVSVTFVALAFVLALRRLRRRWWFPAAGWLLVLAGSFTGYLLPWDQLALRSVTVGENLRGIRWLFDDDVRFVLVDGVEVGPATYARWAVVHVGILPLAALVLAVAVVVRRRRLNR
jgi:quinol-cytochrome oxidoreductase complex cytochrome b subunit